jgi:hypothetical protein
MTKYIMQSGGLKSQPDSAKKYFAELLKGLGNKPKLLWCFFATLPDDCNERFKKYPKLFESYMPKGISPIHINATIENFEKEVSEVDAIYLHGGETKPLYDILKKYDLTKLFDNKSIGTNSASSMVLSKYAWSCNKRAPEEGLGIFPIKFLAHFKSDYGSDDPRGPIDWGKAYDDMLNYGDASLPIHALKEGEFLIMKQ